MILHAPHSIHKKNLILKSQYSVPNLISELQSDKNKGKKARDIR